ncbi:hypothetical protein LJR118_006563 [Acidovorax sp. LjRoot118]|uniref:hypothetical protein n=1 Tax=Acidovorax sp. LjRoot118 TaxID=3342256 RepID=UPI003ECDF676
MLKFSSLILLAPLSFVLSSCSDSATIEAPAAAAANKSFVDKHIALKDLAIGMNISKIKNAKKISGQTYMFDMEYYGGKRNFMASVNDKGEVFNFKTTVDGSFNALQSALEEKLTADNAKPVAFDCKSNTFKPDSSADISIKTCKVAGPSESLKIEEMRMQPTAKVAGLNQLPTVVLSVELEGTQLAADVNAAQEKAKGDARRSQDTARKQDL